MNQSACALPKTMSIDPNSSNPKFSDPTPVDPQNPIAQPAFISPQLPGDPQMPAVSSTVPDVAAGGVTLEKPGLIAPLWHTLLIVALILANSFAGSSKLGAVNGPGSRIILYGGTFVTQFILILLVWFGIRSRGVKMRDLIGGRWKSVESFLLDVGLAAGFLVVSLLLLTLVRMAVGTLDLHNLQKQKDDTLRMLGPLAPHTYLEVSLFVLLSVFAGLFAEIIFRGYLQRQFRALGQNAIVGIVVSAAVFGLAHGYQGPRMMVVIGVFGAFFGILAHFRKSLRPGMMAHAFQDSISGIGLFFLVRQ
jgi:membrane protease YdiL (CAAX protease family)